MPRRGKAEKAERGRARHAPRRGHAKRAKRSSLQVLRGQGRRHPVNRKRVSSTSLQRFRVPAGTQRFWKNPGKLAPRRRQAIWGRRDPERPALGGSQAMLAKGMTGLRPRRGEAKVA